MVVSQSLSLENGTHHRRARGALRDDGQRVLYRLNPDSLVNTLTGFAFEICPVAGPLKRESRALLFLSPLFVSIVFGLPGQELRQNPLQQIIATALFGSFLSMLGMGLWVSALIRRAPRPPAVPAREYESLAARAER
jgi:hypothetical protein